MSDWFQRLAVTPDYDDGYGRRDCVHTMVQSAVGMLGAHWGLEEAKAFIERHGAAEAGMVATAMGHGIVAIGDGYTVFFATKEES